MKYILMLLLLVSCASVKRMRGTNAVKVSGDEKSNVQVTGEYLQGFSQEKYHVIKVYLQNHEDSWERITKAHIDEVGGSKDFHVILGSDLKKWKKSMELDFNLKIEQEKDKNKKEELEKEKMSLLSLKDDEYLVTNDLTLPAHLQTETWVLIQNREKSFSSLLFRLDFLDSSTVTYKLNLKGESL